MARLAAEQWGVASLDDLRACGLTYKQVVGRVERGQLHRLHRGVYAVGHDNPPLEGRFLAAVKACGRGAVLSHFAAAALWELVAWDERRPTVTVPASRRCLHPAVRVHRTSDLDWRDVRRMRGIPVTAPARTLLDIAAEVGRRQLRRAVREAQARRRVSLPELADGLARLGPRPGSGRLAQLIAGGPAPTRSELEDVVLDLLVTAALPRPEVNVPLLLNGRRIVPDFRWPEQRVVVEADGAAWHDHRLAREDDAERQALLEAGGERVVRVTWAQAVARPAQTVARVRAALRRGQ